MLISVSGIGPRIAQGVLSGISASDLREYIIKGNVAALTTIPGVGKKTAERMVVELRDKMSKDEPAAAFAGTPGGREDGRMQALLALTSLGYSRIVAEKAIRQALTDANGAELSLEELIKAALKHSSAK
jgi:Holliday junction DNA helicase RuvA